MNNKQIFVVIWENTESGWGCPDFDAEAYFDEVEANTRKDALNKEKRPHCGYYFTVIPAKIKGA
jgi:hypothetical protein